MRLLLASIALLSAVPALAQESSPRAGQVLRDVNGARLGEIDRVAGDGSVRVIFNGRFITIPASSLEVVDGKTRTKLAKKDASKL